jgi:hypothetical protein
MGALDQAEANRLLNSSIFLTAYTAGSTPMKLALFSVIGSASAAGTEVTGGSYARASLGTGGSTIFPTTGTNGSVTNSNGAISYTNMPAITTVAVEIYDNASRRQWWGALTANKTTALGDTLTFAVSSLTITLA